MNWLPQRILLKVLSFYFFQWLLENVDCATGLAFCSCGTAPLGASVASRRRDKGDVEKPAHTQHLFAMSEEKARRQVRRSHRRLRSD